MVCRSLDLADISTNIRGPQGGGIVAEKARRESDVRCHLHLPGRGQGLPSRCV